MRNQEQMIKTEVHLVFYNIPKYFIVIFVRTMQLYHICRPFLGITILFLLNFVYRLNILWLPHLYKSTIKAILTITLHCSMTHTRRFFVFPTHMRQKQSCLIQETPYLNEEYFKTLRNNKCSMNQIMSMENICIKGLSGFRKYYMYCQINSFKRFWKGLITANFLPLCKENYLTKSV